MSLFDSLKNKAATAAKAAVSGAGTRQFALSAIPENAEQMKAMLEFSLTNPDAVAAFTMVAFCVYPADKNAAIEMLNVLKGPEALSGMDLQFIRDRFMDGKDYLPRSYFTGATPENNYEPTEPCTIPIKEQMNSRDEAGYLKLFLISGGADTPRPIKLRQKASTGEWFLYEYKSLLSGIREPKAANPWA